MGILKSDLSRPSGEGLLMTNPQDYGEAFEEGDIIGTET